MVEQNIATYNSSDSSDMILGLLHTSHVILETVHINLHGLHVICKLLHVIRELIYLLVDGIQSFLQGLNKPWGSISCCRWLGSE